MSNQTETAMRLLKGAARRVWAFVQAIEASPFGALDDRLQQLEVRLADLEALRESPTVSDVARAVRSVN